MKTRTHHRLPNEQLARRAGYWLHRLELALERGDLDAAAEAQRELRRRGLDVRPTFARQGSGAQAADQ